jgi:hypothetical protein
MAVKYSEWLQNISTFSIPRLSKFYQKLGFWFESKPSGNPGAETAIVVNMAAQSRLGRESGIATG